MTAAGAPRRRWLVLIAAPAAVAVWSGWVGLGSLCGFGVIHPLPGIWDALRLNTAITLPVGVEAYGAYALGAWLAPGAPAAARVFARRSAIGALCLGMAGQVVYHLLAAQHSHRAPWPVVVLVSCMPVITLGFGAALTHLLRIPRTGAAHTDVPGTDPAWMAPGMYPDPMPGGPRTGAGTLAGTGPAPAAPVSRTRHAAVAGDGTADRRALPAGGVDRAGLVAELAGQIRAARAAGQEWRPDYDALMEHTGYRRSWCEKAVRAARELAAVGPGGLGAGTVQLRTGQPAPPSLADFGPRTEGAA